MGPGVVLDLSRHLHRIHAVDEAAGTVDVDPGVVLADLTREVERATDQETVVLTDGSSCAMQVGHLHPTRPGRHLAQLLDPGPVATSTSIHPTNGKEDTA